jgi:2-aminoadipate transaminase
VGYIVAREDIIRRICATKSDAGSGALEQMVLAEYCERNFASHVPRLTRALKAKLDVLTEALAENFGAAAEFAVPAGGIFLWVKLPDNVDTAKLLQAAGAASMSFNAGAEWCTDTVHGKSRLRLCFAYPEAARIREGVAELARICHREFGVPQRIANVAKNRA